MSLLLLFAGAAKPRLYPGKLAALPVEIDTKQGCPGKLVPMTPGTIEWEKLS